MNRLMNLMAGAALLPLTTTALGQTESNETPILASATLSEAADASAPNRPGEYPIKLTRRMKVGQRMRVHCEGSEVRRVTSMANGTERPVEASNVSVSFEAEAEIRKVDADGRPVRIAYRIDTCTMNIDGNGSVIAAPNSRITARRDGAKTTFDLDGRPLSETATNALGIILMLHTTKATDDELLGSDQPRSIGESWAIDSEKTEQEFKRFAGPAIDGADLWGVSTLVERQSHHGNPCLLIQSQITAENIMPGDGRIPAGMALKSSTQTTMSQRLFPEDHRLPSLSDFVRTDVNMTFEPTASGRGVGMRVDGFRMAEIETTPLTRATDASSSENGAEAMTSADSDTSGSQPD